MEGRFMVIEGGDGAGKSRLQQALGDRLRAAGRAVVLTREPGGTPLGERLRTLLLTHRSVVDPRAELLLFEAARAQLVAEVVLPALAAGAVVLCDRFAASSVAYQGDGRGLGRVIVEQANAAATAGLTPHLTLLLDVRASEALARRASDGGENRFDRESLDFHQRVRDGYLDLARQSPGTWRVIDASQPFSAVLDEAWEAVDSALAEAST